ncbi:MAG TPA: hypothetical protein VIR01_19840, partial [Pyrinomonadaceae bacterium]
KLIIWDPSLATDSTRFALRLFTPAWLRNPLINPAKDGKKIPGLPCLIPDCEINDERRSLGDEICGLFD